ncbi:MAG: ribonuclease P protein component [Peptostreptococcaceae bacterium]|nr:ribonuclease P protein component [Peptostreptococcaceae bacterium]
MLKPNVLRKKKDFSTLYSKGKSVGDKYVVLFYRKNGLTYNRVAFLASKKVGNSVFRNRARRLMKESFRELEKEFRIGYDLIIIGRNTINGIKCQEVIKSLKSAANRGKLLESGK